MPSGAGQGRHGRHGDVVPEDVRRCPGAAAPAIEDDVLRRCREDYDATRYTYDGIGRVSEIIYTDGEQGERVSFSYTDSLLTEIDYENGIEAKYSYDAADRVTRILYEQPNSNDPLEEFDYTYDKRSHVTSMDHRHHGGLLSETVNRWTHEYSSVGELLEADRNLSLGIETWDYTFDEQSNRTQANLSDETSGLQKVVSETDASLDQIAEVDITGAAADLNSALAYDSTGRMTSYLDGNVTFTYRNDNRVESMNGQYHYTYDVEGNRSAISPEDTSVNDLNAVFQVFDGANLIAQYTYDADGNHTLLSRYVHGGLDRPLIMEAEGKT